MKETPAQLAIIRARARMISPREENKMRWFGNLSLRLRTQETDKIDTMAVDGTTLYFNPQFTLALSEHQLNFVLAHEVLHCALLHPFRFAGKDHAIANQAADYCVNGCLIDSKDPSIAVPRNITVDGKLIFKDILHDPKYTDMTFEQVYDALMREKHDKGQSQPGGGGGQVLDDVQSPPSDGGDGAKGDDKGDGKSNAPPDGSGMTESDWKMAVHDAVKGNGLNAGNIPGNLKRALDGEYEREVPWRAILKRFFTNLKPRGTTWKRPNRRFVHQDIYLPGPLKDNLGEGVICIDMSGSITPEWLAVSGNAVKRMCMECKPSKVHVLYFDTVISHHDVYTDYSKLKLESHGGGGTAFQPMFDFVAAAENRIKPKFMLVFTDLYCFDHPRDPGYPVIWMIPKENHKKDFPFGTVLPI